MAANEAALALRAQNIVKRFGAVTALDGVSLQLADGEIRRTQLQAQTALLERVIAVSSNRASRLSADLALAQQQDSQV